MSMYIYTYICVYTNIYIHIYMYVVIHIYVCIHMRVFVVYVHSYEQGPFGHLTSVQNPMALRTIAGIACQHIGAPHPT